MSPGTRVLSPANYSIEHIWPGNNLGRCDFPRADWDASYPEHWENATSVFFRAPDVPRLFIASGKPIGEKIAANGPFVMNTETEVLQAMRDYQIGKMGILIED